MNGETHDRLADDPDSRRVSPYYLSGGLLDYCIKQGWLIREGSGTDTRYLLTDEGEKALEKFIYRVKFCD